MEIDKWIGCYKVRIFPWIDGKTIYCNVQYYKPGQSIYSTPAFDKSVYITDNDKGRRLAYNFTDSLVNHVAGMKIPENGKAVITVN